MKRLNDLRVIFFGTPQFAVASLQAMLEAGVKVLAVVTAPDKPSGRGLAMQAPAVKEFAVKNSLPVLQPPKLKDENFIAALQEFSADVFVVVAFRMLPEAVWNMPPMGTINVHGSLLPQYRGAAPINRAIMNGETETGVTTFKLKHEIDTGDILLQDKIEILPEDDGGSIHDKLMLTGATLLVDTLDGLASGAIREQPQRPSENTKHAPKIFKEDLRINWTKSVAEIIHHVRGLSPFPTAFTDWNGKMLKIFKAHAGAENTGNNPFETDGKTYLRFAANDGFIYADDVQLEGKKRMKIEELLRGYRPQS